MKLSFAIELSNGGNEFRSCKIDFLFGKVEFHVGDFQVYSGGNDIHFGEIHTEKVKTTSDAFLRINRKEI